MKPRKAKRYKKSVTVMPINPPPRNLCEVLKEKVRQVEEDRRIAAYHKERNFIKELVGEEYFDQCVYDKEQKQWVICGHRFLYNEFDMYYGGECLRSAREVNSWSKYIICTEQLGRTLIELDKLEVGPQVESPQTATIQTESRSSWTVFKNILRNWFKK